MTTYLLLAAVWCVVPVFLCHSIAKRNGREPGLRALLGFFLGWIAVAIVAVAGPQR